MYDLIGLAQRLRKNYLAQTKKKNKRIICNLLINHISFLYILLWKFSEPDKRQKTTTTITIRKSIGQKKKKTLSLFNVIVQCHCSSDDLVSD